jgi:hypothetical protein
MPVEAQSWTCDRCDVTVQWMAGHEANARLPEHWSKEGGELHCLGCRRDIAGDAALALLDEGTPLADRVKVRNRARVEFEITRDPDRQNAKIASSCHTSAAAVQKARERMAEAALAL